MIFICIVISGETEQAKGRKKKWLTHSFSQGELENNHVPAFYILNRNLWIFLIYSVFSKGQFLIRSACIEAFARGLGVKVKQKCSLVLGGEMVFGFHFFKDNITSWHNFVTGKKGNVLHRQSQELEFISSPSDAPEAYSKYSKYNEQLFLIQLQWY